MSFIGVKRDYVIKKEQKKKMRHKGIGIIIKALLLWALRDAAYCVVRVGGT